MNFQAFGDDHADLEQPTRLVVAGLLQPVVDEGIELDHGCRGDSQGP